MSVYAKLAAIQKELVAPKGQFNAFGKYAYRSCEDILKALKPLCDANNCLVFITNELENIGSNNYVKALVRFVDLETGEVIESTAHAREEETKKGMDGSQITGASSSYARKYALAGLFCIDNEKDSDATNQGDKQPAPSQQDIVAEADARAKVIGYINRHKMSKEKVDAICKAYKVESINQMSLQQCNHYIQALTKNGGSIDE